MIINTHKKVFTRPGRPEFYHYAVNKENQPGKKETANVPATIGEAKKKPASKYEHSEHLN
jgi:hypothetical protein